MKFNTNDAIITVLAMSAYIILCPKKFKLSLFCLPNAPISACLVSPILTFLSILSAQYEQFCLFCLPNTHISVFFVCSISTILSVLSAQYPHFCLFFVPNAPISACFVCPIPTFLFVLSAQYPYFCLFYQPNTHILVCSVCPMSKLWSFWSGQNPHFAYTHNLLCFVGYLVLSANSATPCLRKSFSGQKRLVFNRFLSQVNCSCELSQHDCRFRKA